MTTTLISFLGRTRKDENGYQKTCYTFTNGERTQQLAFFGWVMQARITPERMVILGTSGSMWEHLFEGDLNLGSVSDDKRLELIESTAAKNVSQAQLDALAPALEQYLGCEVKLVIIPYCTNEAEQVELLRIIAEHVQPSDDVHLDITHGFRHLPMLALLAALYLRTARKASVKGIWYGAYDPNTQQAPVHDLSGLLRIADGLQALTSFDKDGDYGVFLPLLRQAGLPTPASEALQKASYYENILNVGAATGELRRARTTLDTANLTPDAALLLPTIRERLGWVDEERQFQKQTHLARRALERRDYLRATLYAYEAVITRLCLIEGVPVENFDEREHVRTDYENRLKNRRDNDHESYKRLKSLRNQVAHGTRGGQKEIQQALLNEQIMRSTLDELLKQIENQKLPSSNP
jgi:CRISPR-associated Csx2 family protein